MTETEPKHELGAEKLVDVDPRTIEFEATPIWNEMVDAYGYPLPLEELYTAAPRDPGATAALPRSYALTNGE